VESESEPVIAVRDMRDEDWPAVRAIYEDGIREGNATFETEAPEWEAWDAAHSEIRLVAERGGLVVGWGALSNVSGRCVYRGVAEVSVYVGEAARGVGIGRLLLNELVSRSEAAGYWTLQAGIFSESEASLRLHRACGFRDVGVRERLGELGGAWRDVVFLERRSAVVGA
jgi:phosphinothricin acetyltransferase